MAQEPVTREVVEVNTPLPVKEWDLMKPRLIPFTMHVGAYNDLFFPSPRLVEGTNGARVCEVGQYEAHADSGLE